MVLFAIDYRLNLNILLSIIIMSDHFIRLRILLAQINVILMSLHLRRRIIWHLRRAKHVLSRVHLEWVIILNVLRVFKDQFFVYFDDLIVIIYWRCMRIKNLQVIWIKVVDCILILRFVSRWVLGHLMWGLQIMALLITNMVNLLRNRFVHVLQLLRTVRGILFKIIHIIIQNLNLF